MSSGRGAISWKRVAAAILLAGAAAALLPRAWEIDAIGRGAYCREGSDFHVERGDALLHGVPLADVARAMPFYSVPNAFLCDRLTPEASVAVRSAVVAANVGLVFALGALLYSALCGAGAALLYALMPAAGTGERWLYVPAVLLAAYFLVRRAKAPSAANSVRLGAACGASLLVLPPLFLFPFLLVLYEAARDRRADAARARDAAALCLPPLLFLIPWIAMNWRLTGRFVPFEDGRADTNLITGALGYVRTMGGGDYRAMAGLSATQSALAWAAGEVLRHPLRFLAACLARAAYVARLHPALVLAGAGSAWLGRWREDLREFALFAAYFFAIHCLMPVQDSYFVPVWPLLAVLACGLLAARTRPASARSLTASDSAVHALFTLLLLAQARVLGLTWTYPARAEDPRALARELARDPQDPMLWSLRGMDRLRGGRPKEAAADLARALALDPQEYRAIRYGRALLAGRRPEALKFLAPAEKDAAGDPYKLRKLALVYGDAGDYGRALDILKRSTPAGPADADLLLGMAARAANSGARPEARELLALAESLASADPGRRRRLAFIYRDAGEYDRALDLMKRLTPLTPEDAGLFLDLGVRAEKAGRRRTALDSLAFAGSLNPDSARLLELARDYGELGEYRRAERAARRGRDVVAAWLYRAESAVAAGDRKSALAAAARARGGSPDDDESRRLVLIYQELGEYAPALEIADRRVRARPGDARWRSDRGVLRALLGESDAAASDWKAALSLDADLLAPYLSLGALYASQNRRDEAAELYRAALLRTRISGSPAASRRIHDELARPSPAR